MANKNMTIIVPVAYAELARALAAAQSPGGAGMFERPVFTGANVTHYISSGWIDAAFETLLYDADALFAAAQGLATLAQCQALVNGSIVADCSVKSVFELLSENGLALGG